MRLRLISGDSLATDETGNIYGLAPVWNRAHNETVPTWLLYRPDYAARENDAAEFHWQRPSGAGGGSVVARDLDALLEAA